MQKRSFKKIKAKNLIWKNKDEDKLWSAYAKDDFQPSKHYDNKRKDMKEFKKIL